MPDFNFNKATGVYTYKSSGKVVSPSTIANWIRKAEKQASKDMERGAELLRAGEISAVEWALSGGDVIKNLHRAVGMVAGGGRSNMKPGDWGSVGAVVRRELGHFNSFAIELDNMPVGARLTDAFVSRAMSYARSGWSTYQDGVRARVTRDNQADFEENMLDPNARNCDGCLEESDKGKVPIGTLVPVGDRDCGQSCRCEIEYTTEAVSEEDQGEEERQAPVNGSAKWWQARQ